MRINVSCACLVADEWLEPTCNDGCRTCWRRQKTRRTSAMAHRQAVATEVQTDRVFHNQFISSMHGPILAIRGLLLELARVQVCQTMHLKSREQLLFVVPYLGILNFPRILPLLSDCSLASSTGSFTLEPCGPLLAEKRGPNTLYTNFIVTMSRV